MRRYPRWQSGSDSVRLHNHRNGIAAAETQSGETAAKTAGTESVDQRHQDTGARRPDRMAQGDRAAVDVDAFFVDLEVLVAAKHLRRECLVHLKQIDVADLEIGLLQHGPHG